MSGETDLKKLLAGLRPKLNAGVYVFCTTTEKIPETVQPLFTFQESEGTAFVVRKEEADSAGIEYVYPSEWITLEIHSALEAVGMTAAIAKKLADAQMSANVVAAHFHDHVFVPVGRGQEAVNLLQELAAESGGAS